MVLKWKKVHRQERVLWNEKVLLHLNHTQRSKLGTNIHTHPRHMDKKCPKDTTQQKPNKYTPSPTLMKKIQCGLRGIVYSCHSKWLHKFYFMWLLMLGTVTQGLAVLFAYWSRQMIMGEFCFDSGFTTDDKRGVVTEILFDVTADYNKCWKRKGDENPVSSDCWSQQVVTEWWWWRFYFMVTVSGDREVVMEILFHGHGKW